MLLCAFLLSLPLWECGLKSILKGNSHLGAFVTPLVGVWIEISFCSRVANMSHVTPLVGVWIEINSLSVVMSTVLRHSPCGSVD